VSYLTTPIANVGNPITVPYPASGGSNTACLRAQIRNASSWVVTANIRQGTAMIEPYESRTFDIILAQDITVVPIFDALSSGQGYLSIEWLCKGDVPSTKDGSISVP
jgi:hypothetical protein